MRTFNLTILLYLFMAMPTTKAQQAGASQKEVPAPRAFAQQHALIPAPVEFRRVKGELAVKSLPGIQAPGELAGACDLLKTYLLKEAGETPGAGADIVFVVDTDELIIE